MNHQAFGVAQRLSDSHTKPSMICIPFHDIKLAQREGFRTRDAHLYKHFSTHRSIERTVVFNRPTMTIETLFGRKKLLTQGELIYSKNGTYITKINDTLYSVDTLDVYFPGPILKGKQFIPELYVRNYEKYKAALDFFEIRDFITYESSPLTVDFCGKLSPRLRIFDGVDNLCKHSTYRSLRKYLHEKYKQVIDNYELVFFNSTDSLAYFRIQDASNAEFLSNGVDFDFFSAPKDSPEIFNNLSRPIVVYAGKMQDLLDLDLVEACARNFPAASFVLLGKVLNNAIKDQLSTIRNVIFGGDIFYENLPGYIQNADACFIPYRVDKQHGGDPIKFYEYMAANKPIVTTAIGEIEKYHNGQSILVCAREDFVSSLAKLLSRQHNIHNTLPESMSWRYKADYILRRALEP